jgi:hypothetical protein
LPNGEDQLRRASKGCDNIYDSNGIMTVVMLPCELISGEVMTWDMTHMIDDQNFDVDKKWRDVVAQEVLLNDNAIHSS